MAELIGILVEGLVAVITPLCELRTQLVENVAIMHRSSPANATNASSATHHP